MSYPPKGPADYLELGDWNVACSMCGRKKKASTMVKNWQGLWRCPQHNEPRHPQEYVRAVPDIQTPPWTQPEPADVFVDMPDVIVTEAYVLVGDDTFAADMAFAIATETGLPLLTE